MRRKCSNVGVELCLACSVFLDTVSLPLLWFPFLNRKRLPLKCWKRYSNLISALNIWPESERTDAGLDNSACLRVSSSSCGQVTVAVLGFPSDFPGVLPTNICVQVEFDHATVELFFFGLYSHFLHLLSLTSSFWGKKVTCTFWSRKVLETLGKRSSHSICILLEVTDGFMMAWNTGVLMVRSQTMPQIIFCGIHDIPVM